MIQEYNCSINNQKIKGYLYKPENITKKLPLLILSHGFSSNHHLLTYYAENIAKENILCYAFDFRGGGPDIESDGTMEESTVLTEVDDLNVIINELSSLEIVDSSNIYLLGHSQGGLVSAITATQNNIKTLFLLAPAYNIPLVMRQMELPPENQPIRFFVGFFTRKYIIDARKIQIYEDVKEYKGRVHIFHGTNDSLVPIQYSKEAIKEYENAELTIIENENHTFTLETQKYVITMIIKQIRDE